MGKILEARCSQGMACTQSFLLDCQGALVEPLRLGVLALRLVYMAQIVEALSYVGVALAQRLFSDRQCAPYGFPPLQRICLALRKRRPDC
jgi:hypothetical protein